MIYTPLTVKAMNIAYQAHHGQNDKCGCPYVFHPFHLAEQMQDEYTTCAALLHDVVEDTEMTIEQLAVYAAPRTASARGFKALPQISVLILTPSPSIWLPKAYTHIFRTLYVSPF